jgi:hypothetical protein
MSNEYRRPASEDGEIFRWQTQCAELRKELYMWQLTAALVSVGPGDVSTPEKFKQTQLVEINRLLDRVNKAEVRLLNLAKDGHPSPENEPLIQRLRGRIYSLENENRALKRKLYRIKTVSDEVVIYEVTPPCDATPPAPG